MRSDPLLLAQTTAEGKQRSRVQFRCPRPRGAHFRAIVESGHVGIDFIVASPNERCNARMYRACVSLLASVPIESDLAVARARARARVNPREERSEQQHRERRRSPTSSVAPASKASSPRARARARGQENPAEPAEKPPKKRPTDRYDLFVLIIIALITARGAERERAGAIRTHVARSLYTYERARIHAHTFRETSATVRH